MLNSNIILLSTHILQSICVGLIRLKYLSIAVDNCRKRQEGVCAVVITVLIKACLL